MLQYHGTGDKPSECLIPTAHQSIMHPTSYTPTHIHTQKSYRYTSATDVWSFGLSLAAVLWHSSTRATRKELVSASDTYHTGMACSAQRLSQVSIIADKIVWMECWGLDDGIRRKDLANLMLKCLAMKPNARVGMGDIVNELKLIR